MGAFYRRLSSRARKHTAVTATARNIAVLFCNTLRLGRGYHTPGAAARDERHRPGSHPRRSSCFSGSRNPVTGGTTLVSHWQ